MSRRIIQVEGFPCVGELISIKFKKDMMDLYSYETVEEEILGYAGKYQQKYGVVIYALRYRGDGVDLLCSFPNANRAHFCRDFGANVARAVKRQLLEPAEGRVLRRRYNNELVGDNEEMKNKFLSTVTKPLSSDFRKSCRGWREYNCFEDATRERSMKVYVLNRSSYYNATRWGREVSLKNFIDEYDLTFSRLPGTENMSSEEYQQYMKKLLQEFKKAERRKKRCKKKSEDKKSKEQEKRVLAGTVEQNGQKVKIQRTVAAKIVCSDEESYNLAVIKYQTICDDYHIASELYRNGNLNVEFPQGTYKPIVPPKKNKRAKRKDSS